MRRVYVKETAAIGAKLLDGKLRRDGTLRDDLLGALERGDRRVIPKILRQALPDHDERHHYRERQKHIKRAAGQIDPEISDGFGRSPREAADERNGKRDARRRRYEIVHREPRHLGEVAHRRFAAIALPVRIGDKADRGIERGVCRHRAHAMRIEWQHALQPLQRIKRHKPGDAEEKHRDCVSRPVLLLLFVNSAKSVHHALYGTKHRRKKRALAVEDLGHE